MLYDCRFRIPVDQPDSLLAANYHVNVAHCIVKARREIEIDLEDREVYHRRLSNHVFPRNAK